MKTNFLPAIFTVCCAMIALNGFSQQKPQIRKNEEIIIRKTPSDSGKTIIEIDSNVVTVNGQPLSDYNGDVTIMKRNFMGGADGRNFFRQPRAFMLNNNPDAAFLGVYTAKTEKGVVVNSVLDSSSAKKAGLQKGDIITKVGDKEIKTPEELRNAIQAYKPGDKVTINYLRDGKKKSVKVELSKTPAMSNDLNMEPNQDLMNGFGNGNNYHFRMMPMPPQDFNFNFNNNRPRIGLQIQDTEDSNGVKVQNVLPGSPADKAGLKEGDIITEMNGEKINDVDNVMSKIHSADHGRDFKIKVLRDKKEMNFEVHLPRDLKSTNI